jgi:carboxypeptidase C (cathepsin A)
MPLRLWWTIAALSWHIGTRAAAQFPPLPEYDNVNYISSPSDENVTISYKTPAKGTCTTVFETQRQFSGYVTLPPSMHRSEQGNYTIQTFFWFIESRQLPETAPLTVFINGGPGSSSMVGLFQEIGPCEVVELSQDRLGTVARGWGWDRSSNLLFIDNPVQTGFSYDRLSNGSLNLLDQSIVYPAVSTPRTQPFYSFLNGTFSSNDQTATANTSQLAAHSVWHFLQAFLRTFPEYSRPPPNMDSSSSSASIDLFTESYGGRYGPAIGSFFQTQNTLRASSPDFANSTVELVLNSLGIINGWIDSLVQTPSLPNFAYDKNTYNIRAISQVQQLNALSAFRGAGGCQELTTLCRSQELTYDPNDIGNVANVNEACAAATTSCQNNLLAPYFTSNRSIYDITQPYLDPFPSSLYLEYLNSAAVQQSIGTPLNYTTPSLAVYSAFNSTGDWSRSSGIADLAELLASGTRVALIYGDRDYICNWLGGEAASFAIAAAAGPAYSPWYSAGYAPIVANSSYIGGAVREFGNLSFSRIYDAGHLVPAYQPETAFTVFSRIINGDDISLGNPVDLSSFKSVGEANSTHQNTAPHMADPVCNIRAANTTCNVDHKNMLANGAGVIINGVLYNQDSEWTPPDSSLAAQAGVPGSLPSTTRLTTGTQTSTAAGDGLTTTTTNKGFPTGVFTATAIPSVTSTSSGGAGVPTAAPFLQVPMIGCSSVGHAAAVVLAVGCVAAMS